MEFCLTVAQSVVCVNVSVKWVGLPPFLTIVEVASCMFGFLQMLYLWKQSPQKGKR